MSSSSDIDEIDKYFNQKMGSIDEKKGTILSTKDEDEEFVLGIDLGTTNSCISIWRNNNLEIIPDNLGNRTIPSVVAFTSKSKYVGREAKNQIELNSDNTFYEIKRLIGRKYDDETVINDLQFLTYKVDQDDKKNVILKSSIPSRKQNYTPEEISACILMELKHMAEDYLRKSVTKVVISVPAYFNDAQRQATKDAATIAGLNCLRIINEPTAAALAYGLQQASQKRETDIKVIVYDIGGGTQDLSLLNISNGIFQVLGSAGNTHLGGVDFDNRLISFSMNEFKKKYKIENLDHLSSVSFQKLKKACEDAKKRLSEVTQTVIAVKDFYHQKNLFLTITRELFEKICRDLFILCLKPLDDILKSCQVEKEEIDEIILVGGCTRMPLIRSNLKLFFKKEPNSSINPDEVVSAGAAIQGYILSHESDPFSENVVLLDIIPLSLGVETIGGVMTPLIPRNSVIPIRKKKKFSTDTDYVTSVNIKIFEGERKMTKDNFLVGEFILVGLESAPRGVVQIEIIFSVDVNGIICVTAEDLKNNMNKNGITISGNTGRLSLEEIKELVEEAKECEVKDKIERDKRHSFYEIEDLCSNVKVNIDNEEFKLKEIDRQFILEDIDKIFEWLKEKNYTERSKDDYIKIISRVKNKYGTLILKTSHELDNVQGTNSGSGNLESTTVYGNDDDHENEEAIYEKIETEELGLNNTDDETRKEVKRLRETLVNLCYLIFDILQSLQIEQNDMIELREYIDDVLLWVHVKEKISISEYKHKIDEVNKICNEIVEHYEKNENSNLFEANTISQNIKTKRSELEQLCYALLSSIMSNILSLHEDHIQNLKKRINETLDWLIEIQDHKNEDESIFQNKINDLNDLCNNLFHSILNVHIHTKESIIDDYKNDSIDGTSIESLKVSGNNN
jgi:molecular chaperone DnaK (HSP70)